MAILKALSVYSPILDIDDCWMIQVDLSNQYIKEITNVYVSRATLVDVVTLGVSEDIESAYSSMIENATTDAGYYQFKNGILHLISNVAYIDNTADSFYFTAKRLSEPISDLDADIDIPNTLVPLFVQKVLSNVYQLQGKETPLSIKRRIKELE